MQPLNLKKKSKQAALRYKRPKPYKPVKASKVKFNLAKEGANELYPIQQGDSAYMILSGSFIFGQFIEAMVYQHNWKVKKLYIATLSMSLDNVFSLKNLVDGDYLESMDIIVNNYFYTAERNSTIRTMIEELDHENRFQLAVAGTHVKIYMLETDCGLKITMHGSANMRTSGNVEQMTMETEPGLYDFNKDILDGIIKEYATINKSIRHKKLWEIVKEEPEAENKPTY